MLKNYLLTAWRNLIRNKSFSVLNIAGLALGLCSSLLIYLSIRDEKSIDAFHANDKQLFQVYERNFYDGKIDAGYSTQGLLAEELKKNVPQIRFASGYEYASAPGTQNTFEAGNTVNKMSGAFVSSDFLQMFSFPLLQGDASTAVSRPGSIAISEAMATLFFGNPAAAVGKPVRFDNTETLLVTAVFKNVPRQSSLQFDFLRSWGDFVSQNKWVHNWGNTDPQTFIRLAETADPHMVQRSIRDFLKKYQSPTGGLRTELDIQSFNSRYLYSNFKDGYPDGGRIEYVRLFSLVALFILAIACINFMNLTTARSARRAREVGVRKVMGAGRSSLVKQFIGEAMLLTFIAILFALALSALVLPAFNNLTGKSLSLPFHDFEFWLMMTGMMLITGLVSGSYPAFFMSAFKPVVVLKSRLKFSWANLFLRKGLVVFQFTLSVILIVATVVIYRQMQYVQTKNLGYNRENLVYIPIEGEMAPKYDLFRQRALSDPAILSISKMRNSPTMIAHHTNSISWPSKDPNATVEFADAVVGYDFSKTMKLQLAAGRDFSPDYNDSTSYLLNETAVRKMGLSEPVGSSVSWGNRKGKVIGVIRDFHFNSLHQAIEPLIVRLDEAWTWGTILVRVKAGETPQALANLKKITREINPAFPFSYQFSDLEYARLYHGEQVVSRLSRLFAFIAIFISCLGLFGLALFTAEQRTKEIGIRKVLGATAGNIASMLAVNFLKPVLLAFGLAFPVAWWAMHNWLQGFAYKVDIGWISFIIAGGAALLIALMTVSFQSIKAALVNPSRNLRTE